MKKFIAGIIVTALFPAVLIVGCSSSNPAPSAPGGLSGPTATPTAVIAVVQQTTVTPPTTVQATVNLGSAANYAVLAYSAITRKLGRAVSVGGNLGLYPLSSGGWGDCADFAGASGKWITPRRTPPN